MEVLGGVLGWEEPFLAGSQFPSLTFEIFRAFEKCRKMSSFVEVATGGGDLSKQMVLLEIPFKCTPRLLLQS